MSDDFKLEKNINSFACLIFDIEFDIIRNYADYENSEIYNLLVKKLRRNNVQTIILVMYRKVIVENLLDKLGKCEHINILYQPHYNKAVSLINSIHAAVALIEVAESGEYDIAYCLKLCAKIRMKTPKCKLLIMCSELDQKNIDLVIDAKEECLIDDFVFYDVTSDYLVSKLITT